MSRALDPTLKSQGTGSTTPLGYRPSPTAASWDSPLALPGFSGFERQLLDICGTEFPVQATPRALVGDIEFLREANAPVLTRVYAGQIDFDPVLDVGFNLLTVDPESALFVVIAGVVTSAPASLSDVVDRIERSRSMLDPQSVGDQDANDPVDRGAWERAVGMVLDASIAFLGKSGAIPPLPVITEGDDRSVDVQWRTETRNALVNFPSDESEPIRYFAHDRNDPGRDQGADVVLRVRNDWLLDWLTA